VAGPPDVIARVKLAVSRSITHAPLVTQVAALEALTGDQTALKHERERYARARRLLSTLLNSVPGVECAIPGGGLYVFPSVEGLLKSNDLGLRTPEELGRWLLDDAMIAVVPWDYFGSPDRLRMCFAVSNSVLEEALRRLAVAFSKLTGADIAVPLAVEHR
ncbi:MAG: aminotransferase class I/II-fold pyridoxal phosphate-dependent enzyme, partial [Acidimicrobiia bacterium]